MKYKIAVLDDYQDAALESADWSVLRDRADIRTLDNVLTTPHIGYVAQGLYRTFYEDSVANIRKWLDTR